MKLVAKLIETFSKNFNLNYYVYQSAKHKQLPFAIRLNCSFNERGYSSWGVSDKEDEAYLKAFVEILERITIASSCSIHFERDTFFSKKIALNEIALSNSLSSKLLHPDNSNGCGAGFLSKFAKSSAKKELIERHTILSAQILEIAPIQTWPEFLSKDYQSKLDFFYWRSNGLFVCICVFKIDKGYYFSFGCNEKLEQALRKSYQEIIPSFIFSENEGDFGRDGFQIKPNDIQSFSRYWRFSQDDRYYNYLISSKNDREKIPEIKKFYFSKFLNLPIVENYPFYCYRCVSPDAQQLFFDEWSDEVLNTSIFKNVKIPKFPHPIA